MERQNHLHFEEIDISTNDFIIGLNRIYGKTDTLSCSINTFMFKLIGKMIYFKKITLRNIMYLN